MAAGKKAARQPAKRKEPAKAPRRKKVTVLVTIEMEHSAKDLAKRARSVTFYDEQYKRVVSAKLHERLRFDVQ
jgi:hypothetical protein